MRRTFNCGIGFVFVVPAADAARAAQALRAARRVAVRMGRVVPVPSTAPFEERACEWPA